MFLMKVKAQPLKKTMKNGSTFIKLLGCVMHFFFLFIYFLAVLGLCCCVGFSLVMVSRSYFLVAV